MDIIGSPTVITGMVTCAWQFTIETYITSSSPPVNASPEAPLHEVRIIRSNVGLQQQGAARCLRR